MVKENRSRKLASRCVVAALALIITMTCAADVSNKSDDVTTAKVTEAAQDNNAQQTGEDEATNRMVGFRMTTLQASDKPSTSSVYNLSNLTSSQKKEYKTKDSKTETKKSTAPASTTKAASKAPAATTTEAPKPATTTAAKAPAQNNPPAFKMQTTNKTNNKAPSKPSTPAPSTPSAPASPKAPAAQITNGPALILPEKTYDTDYTHPYGAQTNKITVHWNASNGVKKYIVYIKGGQYSNWANLATVTSTSFTASGLRRDTWYSFSIKTVDAAGKESAMSSSVNIKTARMDYNQAGWEAMCRIVYHEVGGAAGSFWDKPIVYVADCVANQYVAAKYTYKGIWSSYYRKYSSVQDIIYKSGGFLSDAGLSRDGVNYAKTANYNQRVRKAVWGAVYGITTVSGIANDPNVYFWNSTNVNNNPKKKGDGRCSYSFEYRSWGICVNIWNTFWA